MQRKTSGNTLTTSGQGLLVLLMAFCLLAVGSPAQAGTKLGFFGGTSTAANGDTITLSSGALLFETTEPRSIGGGGVYEIVRAADGSVETGTWEALQFVKFVSHGLCGDNATCTAAFGGTCPECEAGRLRAHLLLTDDDTGRQHRVRFTLWCSLPGIPAPPINFEGCPGGNDSCGTETWSVKGSALLGGQFGGPPERNGTLFVDFDF